MLFDDTAAESCDIQKQTWSEENDPAEHFSAVSLSAVLALACGVLSLFYLINRNLLPLPVLTLCSAAFALWRIRRSEGRLTGGAMARGSLTLALAVLVAVPVRDTIYHRELVRQGREFISLVIDAAQKGDSVALSQFKRFQSSRETVDDEIRKLSETSSEQSKKIGEQLGKIMTSITDVVGSSNEASSALTEVSNRIKETDELVIQIHSEVPSRGIGFFGYPKDFQSATPLFVSRVRAAVKGMKKVFVWPCSE